MAKKSKNVLKKKYFRPWLTPTGVEIPKLELRAISQTWDHTTWGLYLKWYETGRKEALITPAAYEITCDEQTESIFEQFKQNRSQKHRDQCDRLLTLLPPIEAEVLRLIFLEGRTEVQIAFLLCRSRTGINLIKNRALSRLKRGNNGDGMSARRFMKGENLISPTVEQSIWEEPLPQPIKGLRAYSPDNHKSEFEAISSSCLRVALLMLSEGSQRNIYLRYWCDFSVNQIHRILGHGVNVIEQMESASISKIKREALMFELGINHGGFQWS